MFDQDLDLYLRRVTITVPAPCLEKMQAAFPFSRRTGIAGKFITSCLNAICKGETVQLRDTCEGIGDTDREKSDFAIRPQIVGVTQEQIKQMFDHKPDLAAISPSRLYRILFFWGFDQHFAKTPHPAQSPKPSQSS